jgi:DNA polymerase-3 subunit gamma/tau
VTEPLDQLLRARGSAARAAAGDPFDRLHRSDRGDVERRAVRQQRRQQIAGLVATTVLVVGLGSGAARQQLALPEAPTGADPTGAPAGALSHDPADGSAGAPNQGPAESDPAAKDDASKPRPAGAAAPRPGAGEGGEEGRAPTAPAPPPAPAAPAGPGSSPEAVGGAVAQAPSAAGPAPAANAATSPADDGMRPSAPPTTVAPTVRVADGAIAADGAVANGPATGALAAGDRPATSTEGAVPAGRRSGAPVRRHHPL